MQDQFTRYTDELEFQEDMEYLRSLAGALFENARQLLASPPDASIYARLKADISGTARKAIFGPWVTPAQAWDAA